VKINRTNPLHIATLLVSAIFNCLAVAARPITRNFNNTEKIIIFYGHTINGNLKSFYDFLHGTEGYRAYFLALDKKYYDRLISSTEHPGSILYALNLSDILTVARSDAIITSHGLHLLSIIRSLTNIKFIDVWHAISYKGFDENDFKNLHSHDEIWVSSDYIKDMYIKRFKFDREKVKVTGYGRTDQLIDGRLNKDLILKKYSIPKTKKYILIAPTWKQDDKKRSIMPFGIKEEVFFRDLDKLTKKYSAYIIFRTHLNSDEEIDVSNLQRILFMPYSKYEILEDFLFIADILVTDWSSTGIDYLPLKRPTIFLDVPPPFKKGFELGPKHRYGDVVSDFSQLKKSIERYLEKPERFIKLHNKQLENTLSVAYGNTLDGHSLDRYLKNLAGLLKQ